ncbi:S8 family peptidase [Anaerobacillus sp. CMMVII]|uniref:S8 family peptidase n=1 Tax=Anaerobacillus sp. CMMVII TaxID=2755588 RepID=UPI0021B7D946|nr:S8 family peptidase [Anaerobacillus sp. CMMVII]MCT8139173.1 S8 family peptidase [Anaerobacillus sp. CMMVII]
MKTDKKLFTILAKNQSSAIPVVIVLKDSARSCKVEDYCRLHPHDQFGHSLSSIKMITGRYSKATIQSLQRHQQVKFICYDHSVQALLDKATPAIGAHNVHRQQGITGKGVGIAVLDTGVYPHVDLTRPTNRIVAFKDLINNRLQPYDDNGHGTHVAGCAAGNGISSGGTYLGPAPDANIIGVKVLNDQGSGSISTVIAGIDWVIENRDRYRIRIINLSLGTRPTTSYRNDPLTQACRKAWRNGIVVVASAGNTGPNGSIVTPGIEPSIITVGASDNNSNDISDHRLASFSSRPPTVDTLIKPDVIVPGQNITSLLAPNSTLSDRDLQANNYLQLSGTSMSAGICSGAIALLNEAYPSLSPEVIKTLLKETSRYFNGSNAGLLQINQAFELARLKLNE